MPGITAFDLRLSDTGDSGAKEVRLGGATGERGSADETGAVPGIGGGGARIDIPVSRLIGDCGGAISRNDISSPASEAALGDRGPRGGGGGTARPKRKLEMLKPIVYCAVYLLLVWNQEQVVHPQ